MDDNQEQLMKVINLAVDLAKTGDLTSIAFMFYDKNGKVGAMFHTTSFLELLGQIPLLEKQILDVMIEQGKAAAKRQQN